jgi:hypothetical protein
LIRTISRPDNIERNVLIFDQANATQPLLEYFDERTVVRVGRRAGRNECKPDWASMLLRARRERPRRSRATKQHDELTPLHLDHLVGLRE